MRRALPLVNNRMGAAMTPLIAKPASYESPQEYLDAVDRDREFCYRMALFACRNVARIARSLYVDCMNASVDANLRSLAAMAVMRGFHHVP